MDYTKLTNLKIEKLIAEEVESEKLVAGETESGELSGAVLTADALSKSDSYTLTDEEKKTLVLRATMSAASKSVVLGLKDGQAMIVINTGGTNAFTVKNLSTDSGTSVGTGKVALVIGSTTANATLAYVLN